MLIKLVCAGVFTIGLFTIFFFALALIMGAWEWALRPREEIANLRREILRREIESLKEKRKSK